MTALTAAAASLSAALSPLAPNSTQAPETNLPDPELVTPGTVGFLVTFALAVIVVIMARSLLRRQRRMRARAGVVTRHAIPVERETAAEQRAAEAGSGERDASGEQTSPAEDPHAGADDPTADEGEPRP